MRKAFLCGAMIAAMTSAASAADLYSEPAVDYVAPLAPTLDWTGFYVGLTGGYGWGEADYEYQNTNFFGFPGGTYDMDVDGWTGGVIGGYNHQIGNFVFGVEGTVQGSNIEGNHDFSQYSVNTTTEVDMLAGVAARAGVTFGRALFYGKVGYAGAQVNAGLEYYTAGGRTWDDDDWANGWQAGLGIDYALTDKVFIGVDYTYMDLGDTDFSGDDSGGTPTEISGDLSLGVVSARVGLRF